VSDIYDEVDRRETDSCKSPVLSCMHIENITVLSVCKFKIFADYCAHYFI